MLEFKIEQIVPRFILADRNGYAMAKAIEAALRFFCDRCAEGADLLRDTDTMPGWRCDEVAWEMGAEWYDSTVELEEKRKQIKSIQSVFRRLGTTDALIDAIESVFGGGSFVREWYEYKGTPYHYSVYVTSEDAYGDKRAEFMRIASIVTPLRSVLDVLQYNGASGSTAFMTATAAGGAYTAYSAVTNRINDDSFKIGTSMLGVGRLA